MECLECSEQTRKYKCRRCNEYCCSMNCFKKHEAVDCTPFEVVQAPTKNQNAHDFTKEKCFQYTTEDTVESEKLTKLAKSEILKRLLQNEHLRDFLAGVDSSGNAWKAMKYAMLEPLFIEFADECLNIIEPSG